MRCLWAIFKLAGACSRWGLAGLKTCDTADRNVCATEAGVRAMRRGCLIVAAFFGLAAGLFAQETATEEGRVRFCAVDIYVDSKASPLAAYQLEFTVTNGVAKIVGIEGGEHVAFHEPPFYDPKAMQHERVILAAFNTGDQLPSGKTRVATIHLQVTNSLPLQCELKLQAAGNSAGARIAAEVSFEERKPE